MPGRSSLLTKEKQKFFFCPMNDEWANEIVEHWSYDGIYSVYDYQAEASHILDESGWGSSLFAVLDADSSLVGELSLGFLDAEGEWVEQSDIEAGRLEGTILWLGFGLKPQLTGKGLGQPFISACVDFAVEFAQEHYGYPGEYAGLGVLKFNQRAIKVYERVGFEKYWEGMGTVNGNLEAAQRMRKRIEVRGISSKQRVVENKT